MQLRHKTTSTFAAGVAVASGADAVLNISNLLVQSAEYVKLVGAEKSMELYTAIMPPPIVSSPSFPDPFRVADVILNLSLQNIQGQIQTLSASIPATVELTLFTGIVASVASVVAVASNFDGISDSLERIGNKVTTTFSSLGRNMYGGIKNAVAKEKR